MNTNQVFQCKILCILIEGDFKHTSISFITSDVSEYASTRRCIKKECGRRDEGEKRGRETYVHKEDINE